jgi:hypothetical protein
MSGSSDRHPDTSLGQPSWGPVTEIGPLEPGLPVPRSARIQQLVISRWRLARIEGGRANRPDMNGQAARCSMPLAGVARWVQISKPHAVPGFATMRFPRHGSGVQWAQEHRVRTALKHRDKNSLRSMNVDRRPDAPLAHPRPGYPSARLHACRLRRAQSSRACLRFARRVAAYQLARHHWTPESCLRKRIPRAPPSRSFRSFRNNSLDSGLRVIEGTV